MSRLQAIDVGVVVTALADQPLGIDGQPAALRRRRSTLSWCRSPCSGARRAARPAAPRPPPAPRSAPRRGVRPRAPGRETRRPAERDSPAAALASSHAAAPGCGTGSASLRRPRRPGPWPPGSAPPRRSSRIAGPSWLASTRAAPSPANHSISAAPRRSSSPPAIFSMAGAPRCTTGARRELTAPW